MQIAFGILFLGITVVVLLSAIWLGIGLANRLVAPIRRLIDAAKEVSLGNLEVAVEPQSSDGDVGALGVTFNTMTAQLRGQRTSCFRRASRSTARRRFTEAVLSGVTAGVIGIDAEGRVTIANRTALHVLGAPELAGSDIVEVVPELEPVVAASLRDSRPEHRDQITLTRGGHERTINIRVTTERATGQAHGYVITLDDITDLVTAQRTSAWADVARRIAHEIKNPLTPIQLSAERLKPQVRQVDHRGSGRLRPVHRHNHPPGRRHRPHGGRVLLVRAHAEADHRGRQPFRPSSARRSSWSASRSRTSRSIPACRKRRCCGRFDAA